MTTDNTSNFIEELQTTSHEGMTLGESRRALDGDPWCECCGERFDGLYTPAAPTPATAYSRTPTPRTSATPSDLGQRDFTIRPSPTSKEHLIAPDDIRFIITPQHLQRARPETRSRSPRP